MKQPKKMKSFRLDEITQYRLETMSHDLQISQADLLQQLVDACYDCALEQYSANKFDRFVTSKKEIIEYYKSIQS